MCEPVSASIAAATVVSAAGTYMSARAKKKAAKAQNAANEYNAQLNDRNAELANQDALEIINAGKTEQYNLRKNVGRMIGNQRASMGASGVDVGTGTPLRVIEDTAKSGEVDALTLERNIYREANNAARGAANFRGQANLSRMQKQDSSRAFRDTLITGGSQIVAQGLFAYGASGPKTTTT